MHKTPKKLSVKYVVENEGSREIRVSPVPKNCKFVHCPLLVTLRCLKFPLNKKGRKGKREPIFFQSDIIYYSPLGDCLSMLYLHAKQKVFKLFVYSAPHKEASEIEKGSNA